MAVQKTRDHQAWDTTFFLSKFVVHDLFGAVFCDELNGLHVCLKWSFDAKCLDALIEDFLLQEFKTVPLLRIRMKARVDSALK